MVREEKATYSIKGKLTAAIAMLLVAVIMVVSSTYAWFTLSTAPEVTGISTAVGANGALEMLLLTYDADGKPVYGNGVVGSGDANTFWGNLVKLDREEYGSKHITLYPSLLNLNGNQINYIQPLQTPDYGADGRVSSLRDGGNFGKWNGDNFIPITTNVNKNTGFRALGVASGLTERQQAYRSALSAMNIAQNDAIVAARGALNANGTQLASIAVRKGLHGDSATYTNDDIKAIQAMIVGVGDSLADIEEAYIQAAILWVLSGNNGVTDQEALTTLDSVKTAAASKTALGERIAAVADELPAVANYPGYSVFTNAVTQYKTALAKSADGVIDTTWKNMSAALTPLVDVTNVKVNGYTTTEVKDKTGELLTAATTGGGIKVQLLPGGGVFADIADLCGDYTADVQIKSDDLSIGVSGANVNAKMVTESDVVPPYLSQTKDDNDGEPANAGGTLPLTELYGYVVDLAFRTNAANSDLLLQQVATDRIYSDNDNTETMGHGSTMTFASNDKDFDTTSMLALMGHIRIVFFNPDDWTIYAEARLDTDNYKLTSDGVTAAMGIWDATLNEGKGGFADAKSQVITYLDQNVIKHVSALVYLDGSTIENKDVAATSAASMSGTANFQFASSATLVPMDYADLHTPGTDSETSSETSTETSTEVSQ